VKHLGREVEIVVLLQEPDKEFGAVGYTCPLDHDCFTASGILKVFGSPSIIFVKKPICLTSENYGC
jgi:hypothetical protein